MLNDVIMWGAMFMRIAFSNPNSPMPLACESIGYHWRQYPIYRPNGYRFFHWLQTESSSGTVKINGREISLPPNSALLIAPMIAHSYAADSDTEEWDTAYLTIYGPLTNYMANFLDINKYRVFTNLSKEISGFIEAHYREFINNDVAAQTTQSALIYHFLMLLRKKETTDQTLKQSDPIIERIIGFLESNYQFPITNNEISQLTGLSTSYQNRIFRLKYGVTPLQYLSDYRMRQAKYLLVTRQDLRVQEVAQQVGFPDTSRFIQLFKKYNHVTPKQYSRTAYQGNNWNQKITDII